MNKKYIFKSLFLTFIILIAVGLFYVPCAQAQYNWWPLPPYNTLWPLWSPELSPVSPITGLPSPIVNSLYRDKEN